MSGVSNVIIYPQSLSQPQLRLNLNLHLIQNKYAIFADKQDFQPMKKVMVLGASPIAEKKGVEVVESCTLVMLNTGNF